MKFQTFGKLLAVIGLIMALYSQFMPISVEYSNLVNIHLLSKQQNVLLFGGIFFIAGIILYAAFKIRNGKDDITKSSNENESIGEFSNVVSLVERYGAEIGIVKNKKCPFCAENIKYEAKLCRFCNNKIEVELSNYKSQKSLNSGVFKTSSVFTGWLDNFERALDFFGNIVINHKKYFVCIFVGVAFYKAYWMIFRLIQKGDYTFNGFIWGVLPTIFYNITLAVSVLYLIFWRNLESEGENKVSAENEVPKYGQIKINNKIIDFVVSLSAGSLAILLILLVNTLLLGDYFLIKYFIVINIVMSCLAIYFGFKALGVIALIFSITIYFQVELKEDSLAIAMSRLSEKMLRGRLVFDELFEHIFNIYLMVMTFIILPLLARFNFGGRRSNDFKGNFAASIIGRSVYFPLGMSLFLYAFFDSIILTAKLLINLIY